MSQDIEKYVELPSQLVDQMQARTVGELLEIDFPVAVGSIDRARLGSYAEVADMALYDPFDEEGPAPLNITDIRLNQSGQLHSTPEHSKIIPAFQECAAITRALENKLLRHRRDLETDNYRLSMKGRANPFPNDMVGGVILPSIHANVIDTPPNGRHYSASSVQPNFFASHADIMRVLKETGYEHILGHELDPLDRDIHEIQQLFSNSMGTMISMMGHMGNMRDPNTITQEGQVAETQPPRIRLQKALAEVMQPAKEGELTAFTSLTFHTNPGRPERGRVTFDAAAHNSPEYGYNPDPMAALFGMLGADFD